MSPKSKKSLKDKKKQYLDEVEALPQLDLDFTTVSSEPVDVLYTPAELEGFEHDRDLGFPGEYPYTRGVHKTMYRGKLWTMRMFAGFGSAADTNQRFHYLLDSGQTGLSVAFDLPTLYGCDSDSPSALG